MCQRSTKHLMKQIRSLFQDQEQQIMALHLPKKFHKGNSTTNYEKQKLYDIEERNQELLFWRKY